MKWRARYQRNLIILVLDCKGMDTSMLFANNYNMLFNIFHGWGTGLFFHKKLWLIKKAKTWFCNTCKQNTYL